MKRRRTEAGALDFEAFRHPVMAVACPQCHARVTAFCKRPSGHQGRFIDFHSRRKKLADARFIATYGHKAIIENASLGTADPRRFGFGIWRVVIAGKRSTGAA